ncbi:hypothetical protein Aperf_G00000086477 [Anoplocephala perfoliata]
MSSLEILSECFFDQEDSGDAISAVTFSANAESFYLAYSTGLIVCLNTSNPGDQEKIVQFRPPITALAFHKDINGRGVLIAAADRTLHVFKPDNREDLLVSTQHPSSIHSIKIQQRLSQYEMLTSCGHLILLWNLTDLTRLFIYPDRSEITFLNTEFKPANNNEILACYQGEQVVVIKPGALAQNNPKQVHVAPPPFAYRSLCSSIDGSLLYTAISNEIHVWSRSGSVNENRHFYECLKIKEIENILKIQDVPNLEDYLFALDNGGRLYLIYTGSFDSIKQQGPRPYGMPRNIRSAILKEPNGYRITNFTVGLGNDFYPLILAINEKGGLIFFDLKNNLRSVNMVAL